jgi:hypothetical protein
VKQPSASVKPVTNQGSRINLSKDFGVEFKEWIFFLYKVPNPFA